MYWPPHTKQMKYKTCTHRKLTFCSLRFVYDPDHNYTRKTEDCLHINKWPSHLIVPFNGVISRMKRLPNTDPDALIANWPIFFKSDQLHHHAKVIIFPLPTSKPIPVQGQTSSMFRPMIRNTHLFWQAEMKTLTTNTQCNYPVNHPIRNSCTSLFTWPQDGQTGRRNGVSLNLKWKKMQSKLMKINWNQ